MQSLYARAWYSKALALLNLKNPIDQRRILKRLLKRLIPCLRFTLRTQLPGSTGEIYCDTWIGQRKPWRLLKKLLLLIRITFQLVTLRGLRSGI